MKKTKKENTVWRLERLKIFWGGDFFTILPKAWIDTKLFVNDYASIGILVFVLASTPMVPTLIVIRKKLSRDILKVN